MRHFICYIMLALAISSCTKHNDEESNKNVPKQEARRTVIVYMAGENNLSSVVSNDLSEMMRGTNAMTKDDRLVCFIDKASGEHPFILSLSDDGKRDTVMHYSEDFYSCHPDSFRSIINTIVKRFPSKEYGLVLWGHATGWLMRADTCQTATEASARRKAYGVDTGSNLEHSLGMRWMNITQMARALSSLPHLRFIFADCCCMMSAEAAYELRHSADYLIGSPAEIPSEGAPYQLLIKHLFSQSEDFYKGIVDEYFDYYYDYYQSEDFRTNNYQLRYLSGYSVPLSVVDLRKMDMLANATRPYYSLFGESFDDSFDTDSIAFYYAEDYPVMHDMKSLMEKTLQPDQYAVWSEALGQVVVYSRFSPKWMTVWPRVKQQQTAEAYHFNEQNYGGISMFVANPAYNYSSTYDYNRRIRLLSWYWALSRP